MINSTSPQISTLDVIQDNAFLTSFGGEAAYTCPIIKLSAEDQQRVDALNKELENIFGTPKETLTDAEKQKESELMDAIDKILQKTEPEPLTKAQENQLDSISKEIDKLFEDGQLTVDEEKKLADLEAGIDTLFENYVPKVLSDADQKELDKLFSALDDLYGVKQPSEAEIARSEEIYDELDNIYTEAAEHSSIQSVLGKEISSENLEKLSELLTEIQETLGTGIDLADLSKEDQQAVDAINKQIDELLGVKQLTDAQQETADKISRQIDKLFEDGVLTADEESTLTTLSEQMEILYGKPKELSDAESQKLGELFAELDKIYAKQTPPEIDNEKLTQLSQELEDLLEQILPEASATEFESVMQELQSLGTLDILDGDDAVSFGELGTDSFVINEFGGLRIENFNPSEGDILMFDDSLGLESQEHLTSLVSQVIQDGEDLFINFTDDDASITLTGISLDELSWDNVAIG